MELICNRKKYKPKHTPWQGFGLLLKTYTFAFTLDNKLLQYKTIRNLFFI